MICDTANGMDSCNKTVMEQELARALLRYRERYGLLQHCGEDEENRLL